MVFLTMLYNLNDIIRDQKIPQNESGHKSGTSWPSYINRRLYSPKIACRLAIVKSYTKRLRKSMVFDFFNRKSTYL